MKVYQQLKRDCCVGIRWLGITCDRMWSVALLLVLKTLSAPVKIPKRYMYCFFQDYKGEAAWGWPLPDASPSFNKVSTFILLTMS